MTKLTPFALKDAPALIESVFPAQKVSYEAQRERKAGAGQTLTALGSYWKGRKPLILTRAIVLGSLLPRTKDPEADLEIFEKLMAIDAHGLARRAYAKNEISLQSIASSIPRENVSRYFDVGPVTSDLGNDTIAEVTWCKRATEDVKLSAYETYLQSLGSYESRSDTGKRPEEVDQDWLYAPVWSEVRKHYADFNIDAKSHHELVFQLGILRFGRRPKLADTFAGSGQIPFESARIGCEVYASDINPIACMLTWGSLELVSAQESERQRLRNIQIEIANSFDERIADLAIETDSEGNRAKAFLYCLETKCPETGWHIPLSPSWIISQGKRTVAKLVPNHSLKRFDIEVVSDASNSEMTAARTGTIQSNCLVYELEGRLYRTPIKTIRGDHKDDHGDTRNNLRLWELDDIHPRIGDVFQERLYAVQWVTAESIGSSRPETFFCGVTLDDERREERTKELVKQNLSKWQEMGCLPDMNIETGKENEGPIRTNGWTYWHHMFVPRQLLMHALYAELSSQHPHLKLISAKLLDYCNKSSQWRPRGDYPEQLFSGQSMKTMFTWGCRSGYSLKSTMLTEFAATEFEAPYLIKNQDAKEIDQEQDLFVTDPPYADSVHYHEITEFFIAWLRKNPPAPFDEWVWDSRRALAIKGSGDDFRKGMVDAYKAMANHMPDNGMQCVMFTHQDTGVWSDMIGIFWAAGLQVVAAWYIATETTSELKKGGYVQGTVILMLRKRPAGDKPGFKQRILPVVRTEVARQIESMLNLNEEVKDKMGEPVFNDSDLQMAGYAAALKVLTAYTQIGGEDVTSFALRPKAKGEVTVVDEIVQQAAEAANSLLVPEGLSADTWARLTGIQRFYLRMMDMETTGASKLDNYQNFAKAFRVEDYTKVMSSVSANAAKLKGVIAFESRDLTDSAEIGGSWLGRLIIGLRQILEEVEPQTVVEQIQVDLPDFLEVRAILIDVMDFFERKAPEKAVRDAAEVLGARLKNIRAIGN